MPSSIDNFWDDVLHLLVNAHRFSRTFAKSQIEEHRHLVTDDGVGDALLHFGPESFADAINERHIKTEGAVRTIRSHAAVARHQTVPATTFIKRLSRNDVGDTADRRFRGIYVPTNQIRFFPRIQENKGRRVRFSIRFQGLSELITAYLIEYRPEKRDRRLLILPSQVITSAHGGDLLLLRQRENEYDGAIVKLSDRQYQNVDKMLGGVAARVFDDAFSRIFDATETR